jgi:hypothetical protein
MKLALIAVIGMLDMSASGQIPGFPEGRPLQMSPQISPTSPTPSRPTPPPSPPAHMLKTSRLSRHSRLSSNKPGIDWKHWQSAENFRYRTGSHRAVKWERYLELELTAPLVWLHFTEIYYGKTHLRDVALSPGHRSIQIKLAHAPVARWKWKVTAYPVSQKQP